MKTSHSVAVLVRGSAPVAAATVRAVHATAGLPHAVYLLLDPSSPAEVFNRAAAVRTEPYLLFLDAGLVPAGTGWLGSMVDALGGRVAAAVGTVHADAGAGDQVRGLLVDHAVFDLLGGFDADRDAVDGYVEEFLARLVGLGYECVAPLAAEFLAGPPQLKRAG